MTQISTGSERTMSTEKQEFENAARRYYGVEKAENLAGTILNNKMFILMNTLLIITGSLITIGLNATNLTNISYQKTLVNNLDKEMRHKFDVVSQLDEFLRGEIRPKINIISSATTVSLPTQLSQLSQRLMNQIAKLESMIVAQCSGATSTGAPANDPNKKPGEVDVDAPTLQPPEDDDQDSIQMINLSEYPMCSNQQQYKEPHFNVTVGPIEYTELLGLNNSSDYCISSPSLAIEGSTYIYAQQVRKTNCQFGEIVGIQVVMGRLVDKGRTVPSSSPLLRWEVPAPESDQSCAAAASRGTGWLFCVSGNTVSGEFLSDGRLLGVRLFTFKGGSLYHAVYVPQTSIRFSLPIKTFMVGTGGGVYVDGKLYFVGYGTVTAPHTGGYLCSFDDCPGITDAGTKCGDALFPPISYDGKAMLVNCLVKVSLDNPEVPSIEVDFFHPGDTYAGSNGRVYKMDRGIGIYISPASWNPHPRFGITRRKSISDISWIGYASQSRVSTTNCPSNVACPAVCYYPNYFDIYPLDEEGELMTITNYNNPDQADRGDLYTCISTDQEDLNRVLDSNVKREVTYTTTSCFVYRRDVWCIVIIVEKSEVREYTEIKPYIYKIKKSCSLHQGHDAGLRDEEVKVVPLPTEKPKPEARSSYSFWF
ncbi:cell attachment protein [Ninorex virus]|nr:cell attachment protein [Ninorex virus]